MSDHGSDFDDDGHDHHFQHSADHSADPTHGHSHNIHDDFEETNHYNQAEDGYYPDPKQSYYSRSHSDTHKQPSNTLRKVALAVGVAGVVVGAIHLWNKQKANERDQREYERRRYHRKRRDFARAKEARRKKEADEEGDEEEDYESADGYGARRREPRRITYMPSEISGSRSRRRDHKKTFRYDDAGDNDRRRPQQWSDG